MLKEFGVTKLNISENIVFNQNPSDAELTTKREMSIKTCSVGAMVLQATSIDKPFHSKEAVHAPASKITEFKVNNNAITD